MSYPPLSDRFMLKSTPQKREWLLISITTHQESQKNDDGRIHSRTQTWKTTDTIAKCIMRLSTNNSIILDRLPLSYSW